MIYKERDKREHDDSDKFARAGAKAEETIAFYLRRAFADSPDVRVFNDLRFVVRHRDETEDAAQIDHLVFHRRGMILVESKSVTSEVRINKHKEWVRVWQGRQSGMPSPVLQTQRQAEQLKKILRLNCEQLRGKMLLGTMQKGFGACPFDVIVAISDDGIVKREVEIPEVCKADQVVERIKAIIQREGRRVISLNPSEVADYFPDEEMENITKFFIDYHHPLPQRKNMEYERAENQEQTGQVREQHAPSFAVSAPKPQPVPSVPPARMAGVGVCEKCGGRCEILWGKYSYYWKCSACGANMAIKELCPSCKEKMKLRKVKQQFYKYCEPCKTQSLYYESV